MEVRNNYQQELKTFNIQIKYYLSPTFCDQTNNSQLVSLFLKCFPIIAQHKTLSDKFNQKNNERR